MRIVKFVLLAVLVIVLVTVALANAAPVTLRVLPETMSGFMGWSWSLTLPLFVVIFFAMAVGLLIGFVWEYFREHKHRAAARKARREKEELRREVTQIRSETRRGQGDDVLALLDNGSVPR